MVISTEEILGYLTVSGEIDVNEFYGVVNQEGLYTLYTTKAYKELNRELLFGMYLYVLANVKLAREYNKKGVSEYNRIWDYKGRPLFKCEVSIDYDVTKLGKDPLYEFYDYVIRTFVRSYAGKSHRESIPKEVRLSRKFNLAYPSEDISFLLVILRSYYGRYNGRKEFDLMATSMVDEFRQSVNRMEGKGRMIGVLLSWVGKDITERKWWRNLAEVNGNLVNVQKGFTKGDIDTYKKLIEELK